MSDALKVLGQSYPASATLTALYTVPGGTSSAASSLVACNQAAYSANVRLSVAVAGAADEAKQYLVYDALLFANETKTFTIGPTLATTDVVRVQSSSGTVSFNLFGAEIT